MSAIVAAHGSIDAAECVEMLDNLAHRGPDGSEVRGVADTWLGYRHLDLSGNGSDALPLHDPDRRSWFIADGTIFDAHRLRRELEEQGEATRTDADLELVLRLLVSEGADALARIRGMFAFAMAGEDGGFVAGRDLLGLVPLYWYRDDDLVLFASELKAFHPKRRHGVEPFPPGHVWTPEAGLRRFRSLDRPLDEQVTSLIDRKGEVQEPPEEVLAMLRTTLISAVRRCLDTDAPVGVLLSGGLDSSLVTAIAADIAQREGRRLPTFSVGLEGSDDLAAAKEVASCLGVENLERTYTEDELIDWVPEVIRVLESFDPRLVQSAVPNLLVSRFAARDVKVLLIGEGADELFAGYSQYEDIDSREQLQKALLGTIEEVHTGGLQRVDRIAAANGVQSRMPFLDIDVYELGFALPPAWKLANGRVEKWMLRQAFQGWLPDDILWREKAQFGEGSGAREILREHYGGLIGQDEFEAECGLVEPPLRSREELAYFRIFRQELEGVDPAAVIARWKDTS